MSSNIQKALDGKAKAVAARQRTIAEQVEDILANRRVNDELKHKLRYCQDQIASGRTDQFLKDLRAGYIAEVSRMAA